jgi:hypothetical protein
MSQSFGGGRVPVPKDLCVECESKVSQAVRILLSGHVMVKPTTKEALDTLIDSLGPAVEAPDLSREDWEAIYPDHPEDSLCLDCGQRFDEHTLSGECLFVLNNDENRLAEARSLARRLLTRGFKEDDLVLAVTQTNDVVRGGFFGG